jgi:hypothetical protein
MVAPDCSVFDLMAIRRIALALVVCHCAALGKPTTTQPFTRQGDPAGNFLKPLPPPVVKSPSRPRRDQSKGVWVTGLCEDIASGPNLDRLAGVHDEHSIRPSGYKLKVVAHDENCHSGLTLDIFEQRKNFNLYCCVERRRWFVRNQDVGPVGYRYSDRYALCHSARKLVWVAIHYALRTR